MTLGEHQELGRYEIGPSAGVFVMNKLLDFRRCPVVLVRNLYIVDAGTQD